MCSVDYFVHITSTFHEYILISFVFAKIFYKNYCSFYNHMGIFATFIRSYVKSIPFFSCFLTPCISCHKLAVRLIALLKKNSRWLLLRIYIYVRIKGRKRSCFPLFWPCYVSDARKKKYEKRVCSDVRLST
jgi:hypothetical protein